MAYSETFLVSNMHKNMPMTGGLTKTIKDVLFVEMSYVQDLKWLSSPQEGGWERGCIVYTCCPFSRNKHSEYIG